MTNWPLLSAVVVVDLALLKGAHSLLGEPERVLEKFHDLRALSRSNLQAQQIIPRLATLYSLMMDWRAQNAGSVEDSLLAVGYESTLGELTDVYVDYVRLDRLPDHLRRSALALGATFMALVLILPILAVDHIRGVDDVPRWAEVAGAVLGVVALTLAGMAAVFYYRSRLSLARLLEKHG